MAKALIDPNLKRAIETSAREFAEVMTSPMTTDRNRYLRELVAVTRAAAIGGDYTPAVKGYELLGKVLGHVVEKHEHVVGRSGYLSDATDAELVEILQRPLLPAPTTPEQPPTPAVDANPTPAEEDAAEKLLYV